MVYFMLQKFDKVAGNCSAGIVRWSIGLRLIRVVALDDGDDTFRVHGDVWSANAIFR